MAFLEAAPVAAGALVSTEEVVVGVGASASLVGTLVGAGALTCLEVELSAVGSLASLEAIPVGADASPPLEETAVGAEAPTSDMVCDLATAVSVLDASENVETKKSVSLRTDLAAKAKIRDGSEDHGSKNTSNSDSKVFFLFFFLLFLAKCRG